MTKVQSVQHILPVVRGSGGFLGPGDYQEETTCNASNDASPSILGFYYTEAP